MRIFVIFNHIVLSAIVGVYASQRPTEEGDAASTKLGSVEEADVTSGARTLFSEEEKQHAIDLVNSANAGASYGPGLSQGNCAAGCICRDALAALGLLGPNSPLHSNLPGGGPGPQDLPQFPGGSPQYPTMPGSSPSGLNSFSPEGTELPESPQRLGGNPFGPKGPADLPFSPIGTGNTPLSVEYPQEQGPLPSDMTPFSDQYLWPAGGSPFPKGPGQGYPSGPGGSDLPGENQPVIPEGLNSLFLPEGSPNEILPGVGELTPQFGPGGSPFLNAGGPSPQQDTPVYPGSFGSPYLGGSPTIPSGGVLPEQGINLTPHQSLPMSLTPEKLAQLLQQCVMLQDLLRSQPGLLTMSQETQFSPSNLQQYQVPITQVSSSFTPLQPNALQQVPSLGFDQTVQFQYPQNPYPNYQQNQFQPSQVSQVQYPTNQISQMAGQVQFQPNQLMAPLQYPINQPQQIPVQYPITQPYPNAGLSQVQYPQPSQQTQFPSQQTQFPSQQPQFPSQQTQFPSQYGTSALPSQGQPPRYGTQTFGGLYPTQEKLKLQFPKFQSGGLSLLDDSDDEKPGDKKVKRAKVAK